MDPYLIYTQRANKKGKKYKYGKIKITQITHNWGLNLSLNILQITIQIIPDFHTAPQVGS